jgi:hypothetical protein
VYREGDVMVIGNSMEEYIGRCKLVGEKVPDGFGNRMQIRESKLEDFRESFNDTYCYFV